MFLKPHHKTWLEIDWEDFLDCTPVCRSTILTEIKRTKRWYVYIIWRDDLGQPIPFYVGKGTGRRITQHTAPSDIANKYKSAVLAKLKRLGTPERYSVVASFDDEASALSLETELVAKLGRRDLNDGPLANKTEGGDGTRGHLAKSRGESASARPVVAKGCSYDCLEDAAEVLGVTAGAITQRIKNGWQGFYYTDEGQRPEKDGILGRYRRPVVVPGGAFESLSDASKQTGESVKSLHKRIRAGWPGYFYTEEGQRERKTHDKPCSIEGEFFSSQLEAANTLKIGKGQLAKRLRSSNYADWIDLSGTVVKTLKQPVKAQRLWVDEVEYATASQASEKLGVKPSTILFRLKSSNFPNYVGEGIEKDERSSELAKSSVPVCVAETRFNSLSEASRIIGIDINTLKNRCCSHSWPEYTSEDPTLAKRMSKDGRAGLVRIVIDGKTYRSINAAFKATGEARAKIKQKLDDREFPNYRHWPFGSEK